MKIVIIILALALIVLGIVSFIPKCQKYEEQLVHHDSWVQFIPSGKVMIPIFHPETDKLEMVCIER